MWRAQVVDYHRAGLVSITIPDLYRQSILREVQAVMDAQIGDDVLVVDLNPGARVHDWLVIGYVSELGRFGAPYPHTHPLGQVDGLVDSLAGKANTSALANYALNSEVALALTTKSDVPGEWANITLMNGHTVDATQPGPSPRSRMTPLGLQIQSRRLRGPSPGAVRDTPLGTVHPSHIPPYDITFHMSVQRSGTGNTGASVTMKLKTRTGEIHYVSETTSITSQGTGAAAADYISLTNILLVW